MEKPTIINVMAASLDGFVAVHSGQSDHERQQQGFTESMDQEHLHELIKSADAIILGSQTMTAAGGALDVQRPDGSYPVWITFTNRGIPGGHNFWRQRHIKRWIVSKQILHMDDILVKNFVYDHVDPVDFCINMLQKFDFKRVLLFGGGEINRLFYEAGAVDELILTICPLLVASSVGVPIVNPGLSDIKNMNLVSVKQHGNLIFAHYNVIK